MLFRGNYIVSFIKIKLILIEDYKKQRNEEVNRE